MCTYEEFGCDGALTSFLHMRLLSVGYEYPESTFFYLLGRLLFWPYTVIRLWLAGFLGDLLAA